MFHEDITYGESEIQAKYNTHGQVKYNDVKAQQKQIQAKRHSTHATERVTYLNSCQCGHKGLIVASGDRRTQLVSCASLVAVTCNSAPTSTMAY